MSSSSSDLSMKVWVLVELIKILLILRLRQDWEIMASHTGFVFTFI
jgi:hypothetical protein